METSRLAGMIKLWAVWVLVSVFLMGVDRIGGLTWLHAVGEPATHAVSGVGEKVAALATRPLQTIIYWRVGASRMADLEARLAQMAVSRQELEALRVENAELRQKFGIVSSKAMAPSLVKVVSMGKQLLIEKTGAVSNGSVVVDLGGVLVGKVVRVGQYTAIVDRPSDAGVKIAVKVGNSTGLVEGDGRSAQLTGVLQAESLQIGDVVVTSGVDDQFPPGLVIGQVVELTGKPADVTKGGKIELLFKMGNQVLLFQ